MACAAEQAQAQAGQENSNRNLNFLTGNPHPFPSAAERAPAFRQFFEATPVDTAHGGR
jgi:hypothetical protein